MNLFHPVTYYAVMSAAHRPNYGSGQRAELREIAITAGAQALGAAVATAGAAFILTRLFQRQEARDTASRGGSPGPGQQHVHIHLPTGAGPDAWAPFLQRALAGDEPAPLVEDAF